MERRIRQRWMASSAAHINEGSNRKTFIYDHYNINIQGGKLGDVVMKRELGIARCGLACCLCSENVTCAGCDSGECPDKDWCENRQCSLSRKIEHCYECNEKCKKGLLSKIKPYAFTEFARRYGQDYLLDCLERNEKNGVIYHRDGINGDYDDFDDLEMLIEYIRTGHK